MCNIVKYYENGGEGEYLNNMRHGYGISYYKNGDKAYEGYFKNDKKHGYGIIYTKNNVKYYEGMWEDNDIHGEGTSYDKFGNVEFSGLWKNGKYFKGILNYINLKGVEVHEVFHPEIDEIIHNISKMSF